MLLETFYGIKLDRNNNDNNKTLVGVGFLGFFCCCFSIIYLTELHKNVAKTYSLKVTVDTDKK